MNAPIWNEYKYRSMAHEFGPSIIEGGPTPALNGEALAHMKAEMDARGDLAWTTVAELFYSLSRQSN